MAVNTSLNEDLGEEREKKNLDGKNLYIYMSYTSIVRKKVFREALNLDCSNKMAVIITRLSDCKENIILIVKIK